MAARPSAVLGLGLAAQSRGVTTVALPDLSYDYDALEPVISGDIMQIRRRWYASSSSTSTSNRLRPPLSRFRALLSSTAVLSAGHVNDSIVLYYSIFTTGVEMDDKLRRIIYAKDLHFSRRKNMMKASWNLRRLIFTYWVLS
ncbi:hypothetical protein QQ045_028507 [Rhodiola kirilowii]